MHYNSDSCNYFKEHINRHATFEFIKKYKWKSVASPNNQSSNDSTGALRISARASLKFDSNIEVCGTQTEQFTL